MPIICVVVNIHLNFIKILYPNQKYICRICDRLSPYISIAFSVSNNSSDLLSMFQTITKWTHISITSNIIITVKGLAKRPTFVWLCVGIANHLVIRCAKKLERQIRY